MDIPRSYNGTYSECYGDVQEAFYNSNVIDGRPDYTEQAAYLPPISGEVKRPGLIGSSEYVNVPGLFNTGNVQQTWNLNNDSFIPMGLARPDVYSLSGFSTAAHVIAKRKRKTTPAQRQAANVRERRRMCNLNSAFDRLRRRVPLFAHEKRLSRIQTLRLAITYISFMTELIAGQDIQTLMEQRQTSCQDILDLHHDIVAPSSVMIQQHEDDMTTVWQ